MDWSDYSDVFSDKGWEDDTQPTLTNIVDINIDETAQLSFLGHQMLP